MYGVICFFFLLWNNFTIALCHWDYERCGFHPGTGTRREEGLRDSSWLPAYISCACADSISSVLLTPQHNNHSCNMKAIVSLPITINNHPKTSIFYNLRFVVGTSLIRFFQFSGVFISPDCRSKLRWREEEREARSARPRLRRTQSRLWWLQFRLRGPQPRLRWTQPRLWGP